MTLVEQYHESIKTKYPDAICIILIKDNGISFGDDVTYMNGIGIEVPFNAYNIGEIVKKIVLSGKRVALVEKLPFVV